MERRTTATGTVDDDEVARFSRLAGEWWDARGPMAALHALNPVRLAYIRDRAAAHFGRDPKRLDSLAGLRVLDIGCGAGILCEPLARLGAAVTGADPSAENIAAARHHAAQSGVAVDYRNASAEALAEAGEIFDIVLAMEVVEHVADVGLFVRLAAAMVKPGGLMVVATLNRTREELCAGDRRRRIHPALAAARHPSMGKVRDPERTRDRARAEPAARDRRDRRDL